MKLSVIVPVYNEYRTIEQIIRIIRDLPIQKEILVVDDGSTDGTREILKKLPPDPELRLIFHEKNCGKGKAIQTGIAAATGEAIIIQDADLEYNPMDYVPLMQALRDNGCNVVYGSRFLAKKKVTSAWHRFVNFFLTWLTNILYGTHLTDMETCYKLIRRELFQSIQIYSTGFEFEVEITAKILKKKQKIFEVPVSYRGRSYHEGKKIGWQDGVKAVWYLFKYRF